VPDPVFILQQRADFLNSIMYVAGLCNWPKKRVEELQAYVLEELIRIDNGLYDAFELPDNHLAAYALWEREMEKFRRWLELVLGVKIKYV